MLPVSPPAMAFAGENSHLRRPGMVGCPVQLPCIFRSSAGATRDILKSCQKDRPRDNQKVVKSTVPLATGENAVDKPNSVL